MGDRSAKAIEYHAFRGSRLGDEARAGIKQLAASMDSLAATITAWRAELTEREEAAKAKEEAAAKVAASRGGWLSRRAERLADALLLGVAVAILGYLGGFHRTPDPPASAPASTVLPVSPGH